MGWLEWAVLALLAAWLAVSLWRMLHHRGLLRLLRRLHALPDVLRKRRQIKGMRLHPLQTVKKPA